MSDDLIADLREAAEASADGAIYRAAADEIERCHARLEIDHCYKLTDEFIMVRIEVPYKDRHIFPDAVETRDSTIEILQP